MTSRDQTYFLLAVAEIHGSFKVIDSYKFKKKQKINSVSVQPIINKKFHVLCLCEYNGSKLMQVVLGIDGAQETRLFRKLRHPFAFRCRAKQVMAMGTESNQG